MEKDKGAGGLVADKPKQQEEEQDPIVWTFQKKCMAGLVIVLLIAVILGGFIFFSTRPIIMHKIAYNEITGEYKVFEKTRLTPSHHEWNMIGEIHETKEDAIRKLNSHIKKETDERRIDESWETILEVP